MYRKKKRHNRDLTLKPDWFQYMIKTIEEMANGTTNNS